MLRRLLASLLLVLSVATPAEAGSSFFAPHLMPVATFTGGGELVQGIAFPRLETHGGEAEVVRWSLGWRGDVLRRTVADFHLAVDAGLGIMPSLGDALPRAGDGVHVAIKKSAGPVNAAFELQLGRLGQTSLSREYDSGKAMRFQAGYELPSLGGIVRHLLLGYTVSELAAGSEECRAEAVYELAQGPATTSFVVSRAADARAELRFNLHF